MNVKRILSRVNWPVMSARLVTLAGFFTAGGQYAHLVPVRCAVPIYLAAIAIKTLLPAAQDAANILRPDSSPVPSVKQTLDAQKAQAEATATETATAALLENPKVLEKIAGAVRELTNMEGFSPGELGQAEIGQAEGNQDLMPAAPATVAKPALTVAKPAFVAAALAASLPVLPLSPATSTTEVS